MPITPKTGSLFHADSHGPPHKEIKEMVKCGTSETAINVAPITPILFLGFGLHFCSLLWPHDQFVAVRRVSKQQKP